MLHLLLSTGALPLPITTPQKHLGTKVSTLFSIAYQGSVHLLASEFCSRKRITLVFARLKTYLGCHGEWKHTILLERYRATIGALRVASKWQIIRNGLGVDRGESGILVNGDIVEAAADF